MKIFKILMTVILTMIVTVKLTAQTTTTVGAAYTSGNSCSGTVYDSGGAGGNMTAGAASTRSVRIGNGTTGSIQVCFTSISLSTSMCSGVEDAIVIYEADASGTRSSTIATVIGYTGPSALISSASNGQSFCVTVVTTSGYAAISHNNLCTTGNFQASWTTIAPNGTNACTGVAPAGSSASSGVSVNQCGTSFSASSIGRTPNMTTACQGTPSGSSFIWNNLDCNTSTSGAPDAAYRAGGGDVSFSVENPTWYTFCPQTTGVWTLTLTKGSCTSPLGEPTTTEGYQYALFNGTASNLGAPISGGTNGQNITGTTTLQVTVVSTPTCYQMVIDGFAGAQCSYGFTLAAPAGLCVILPVKLLNYQANYNANADAVELSWQTGIEKNNQYIAIERSIDNKEFYEIGKMDGAVNSNSARYYQYFDKEYQIGVSYYRLKFIDMNGNVEYSAVESVEVKDDSYVVTKETVSINPNPVVDRTQLIIMSKEDQEAVVSCIDPATGKVMLEFTEQLNNGINHVTVDMTEAKAGIYILTAKTKQNVYYNRIVKQ